MSKLCVLLVAKEAALDRLPPVDVERMAAAGVIDQARLQEASDAHQSARCIVRAALTAAGASIRERRLDGVRPADADGVDLAVTVGGDGSVLTLQRVIGTTPVLAVNSDPHRSIGHYTRCRADDFGDALAAWQAGTAGHQQLPRLEVRVGNSCPEPVLNDCLFTNTNPAAMTRYRIVVDGQEELQASSGVWTATASGSTGAIHSAGMPSHPVGDAVLLYRVREPYQPRTAYQILQGAQQPPVGISLTAACPGLGVFIDGAHQFHAAPPGTEVRITPCDQALQLILPHPNS